MILRCLVDYGNSGSLFCFTIETDDEQSLFSILKSYSNDVRFLEEKKEKSRFDKGCRKLKDGSTILRCQYFGEKFLSMFAFKNSPGRWNIIEKAVAV